MHSWSVGNASGSLGDWGMEKGTGWSGMASLVGLQPKVDIISGSLFLKTRLILKLMSGILMADGSDKPHDFDCPRDPESPRPCRSITA